MELANDTWLALGSFWIAIVILGVGVLGLFVLTLRFGPRRGYWAQPAARYRPPGRRLMVLLYVFGALHVLATIGLAASDAVDASVIWIGLAAAAVYVGFAHATTIGTRAARSEALERTHVTDA